MRSVCMHTALCHTRTHRLEARLLDGHRQQLAQEGLAADLVPAAVLRAVVMVQVCASVCVSEG
jgi:hypothetical protein